MPSFLLLHNFSSSLFPIKATGISIAAAAAAARTTTAQFIQFRFNTSQYILNRPLVAAAAASGNPSEQLWNLDKAFEDSVKLLEETNAAVEMQKYGAMLDFTGIDVSLVETAIKCARRGFPVSGNEATALVSLLQFGEALQLNIKAAIKEDSDWFRKLMPLSEMIMELVISRSLIKFIEQLVDEDGSVKDSASSNLRYARDQVRILERKVNLYCLTLTFITLGLTNKLQDIRLEVSEFSIALIGSVDLHAKLAGSLCGCLITIYVVVLFIQLYQLMESMVRNEIKETSSLEVCNIDGRWCIKSGADTRPNLEGLLLSRCISGSGTGSLLEPLSAVPLNDELQQARASVAKAEADVLLKITEKMQIDLIDIENLFDSLIQIDMINARARYSLSFEGACPDLYLPQSTFTTETLAEDKISTSQVTRKKWTLYLPKAHHPLLLQQHRHNLQMAMKDLSNAKAEIRRRKQLGGPAKWKEETNLSVSSLEKQVAELKQALPVPFDILIAQNTKVLVITGPNTGGKTICLKTVGLAAMMAKSGLYVLASEPARIPWFDFVLADIGDEQSLTQSLSTFSGHLKQISVGAGTNPLEGAALGMSLLESFADAGALLTIATTHHGELKTLKYSNDAFENACMEFDEVNLKPTYRILWGVPGRSNAINISKRLGLPTEILDNARELYGAASAEINEVIVDMERFKQDYHEHINEAQHYLRLSKDFHQSLLLTRKRVMKHGMEQRYRMMQEIYEAAASARSIIHKKVRQSRSVPTSPSQQIEADEDRHTSTFDHHCANLDEKETNPLIETPMVNTKPSITEKRLELPKVGDMVNVPSFSKKAKVLKVDPSKEEIVVQAGNLKLKLKLSDIVT
ncbi:hypothetical protein BUALT_Bualt06G0084400 [Buddleja alternifolia]|uniref:DNA mismatch repair proteins mutS family domain-containing protein n=1 Tax=Buddleja alternifolia TaxID=168488 RepID=A0AAV6XPU3_9LAMI|nr:hypothetical protein BUALT_Bualt06G0084400 [Buddleja alternifolia]